uniref:Uncharacterized protein n=1 Tax=Anguilla anguilla TaxID=7936 RepID=A0A0E9WHI9_ANGAN
MTSKKRNVGTSAMRVLTSCKMFFFFSLPSKIATHQLVFVSVD